MIEKIRVSSIAQARGYLRRFAAEGYDVFRGQHHNWPARPSLFRLDGSAQRIAGRRLSSFLEWCAPQPRLAIYKQDPTQLIAIAQHYGIPTPLLDATYSPEVALFFALHGAEKDPAWKPVVFVWKKSQINGARELRVLDIQVDNLWRLEAQHGLFIEFEEDTKIGDSTLDGYQLIFDKRPAFTSMTPGDIYPSRKSLLETVLDIYFYRETTQSVMDELTKNVRFVLMKKWQSYEAAFSGGAIVLGDEKLESIDQAWFTHSRTPYDRVGPARRKLVPIDASRSLSAFPSLEASLRSWTNGRHRPTFEVSFFGDAIKDREISKAFNHVFDGIIAFPYSERDRLQCLTTCLRLLPVLRVHESIGVDSMKPVLGETVIAEFAPSGGRHLGCAVSRDALRRAVDDTAYKTLRPFFQRYLRRRKLDLLCFCLDHIYSFRFPSFITLFATQVIPSQFAGFLHEHLMLLEDGGGLWDIAFDPIALGYFSISRYQFYYPFSLEEHIDRVLILFAEMKEPDIIDEIVSAAPRVLRTNIPMGLRLHGYGRDSREVWQIPEALKLLRMFAAHGGMSILEVFTLLQPKGSGKKSDMQKAFLPMGAFELWVILRGEMKELKEDPTGYVHSHRDTFLVELSESNSKLEKLLKERGVRT